MTTGASSTLDDIEHRARTLAAIADPARLAILDTLVLGDTSPSVLAEMLAMSSNLLAHHLRVLEHAGLVSRHRSQADRRRSYLRLLPSALDALLPGQDVATTRATVSAPVTRVVFVCTANSARSQLAAALWSVNSRVPATSGGTHPARAVAPGALEVAERHQLPLAQKAPQLLPDPAELTTSDYLVTVCDNAHEDLTRSGTLPAAIPTLHWSVPDPVPVGTSKAFQNAYTDLEGRVITLARHLTPTATAPLETA